MPPRDRPGPLQPFDLSLFLPASTPGTPGHSRPNKRPHSPSVGPLGVPAKRRLKAGEGTQTPKFAKSPLSGSSTSARFAPAHFHALLQGPDSPAKRLDFGSSEASDSTACEAPHSGGGGSGTPRRSPKRTPLAQLRRSPRISARKSGSLSGSSGSPSGGQAGEDHAGTAIRVPATAPLLIPRVVTPPDPQSVHYPGFLIHQDPHTVLPSTSQNVNDPVSDLSDKEIDKENHAPRRKSAKKVSTPVTPSDTAWLKAGLFSPSMSGVKKPVPASPHPKHVQDYLSTPRPRATPKDRMVLAALSPAVTLVGVTPGRMPLGKEERKKMRMAMEEELDDVEGDDELLL